MKLAYKLVPKLTWHRFTLLKSTKFYGDHHDIQCGFIHLSLLNQVPIVKDRKYSNENPYVLTINLLKCVGVKWRFYDGQIYPNVQGYLELHNQIIDVDTYEHFKLK